MARDVILATDGLTMEFRGFRAVNGVALQVERGTIHALIGPNGAGKTTMMDCITGKTRPDSGIALFDGTHDLLRSDEPAIADLGIGRKFQKPTVFESHTVADNILLALKGPRAAFASLFGWRNRVEAARIDALLETVGLLAHRGRPAADLSHGQKQWLEIGMLLIQDPELLMLDEPVAGMSVGERIKTAELLNQIIKGRSVLVIEHDMKFVEDIAHRVTVLHQGKVLSEGSMDRVKNDPKVIEVYLGH